MANFDLTALALKAVCPNNEILLDDKGLPSVMVYIPKFKVSDVIAGGSSSTHPAFIVNGTEVDGIYISKYQNVVQNGRAYSLPCEDPKASVTFDVAKAYCEAKGAGWHLMTNAEWSAIALWCRINNCMPKGNNNYGRDHTETTYKAIPANIVSGQTNRVMTGTGPLTWSHDGTLSGIWDLNGNVYEWNGGYRTVDGEIQIIPNNDAAAQISQTDTSTLWKAIKPDGTLVAPGTVGTLKWDYAGSKITLASTITTQSDTSRSTTFETLAKAADITSIPEVLKALALFPADTGDHGGDYLYMNNVGERLGYRGGYYFSTSSAGVFSLSGVSPRSNSGSNFGFRSAFVKL